MSGPTLKRWLEWLAVASGGRINVIFINLNRLLAWLRLTEEWLVILLGTSTAPISLHAHLLADELPHLGILLFYPV